MARRPSGPADSLAPLFQPVDNASLAFFRIAVGLIMVWQVVRYVPNDWIARLYVDPPFHFTYPGFGWVKPLPGPGMRAVFAALGLLACGVVLGLFYRASALLFGLGYAYVFLIEQASYQNHLYLLTLLAFVLAAVPAHGRFSLDARFRPGLRSSTAPTWALRLLRFQTALPYVFGGLAKLNGDWLRGEPMRGLLSVHRDAPIFGRFLDSQAGALFFSWGGLLFDLLIVPALLNRRTRNAAFALALAFHLTNEALFTIGVFPWLMMAATTIFLEPDWPLRLLGRPAAPASAGPAPTPPSAPRTVALLAFYGLFQALFPLRHWLYPGNVAWTMEGHRFSWRMMLHRREAKTTFFVTDPATGKTRQVEPLDHLTTRQALEMSYDPRMIRQFALHLADRMRGPAGTRPEVRATAFVLLNGRPPKLILDPNANLAVDGWMLDFPVLARRY